MRPTISTALEQDRGTVVGGDHSVEVRTERAVAAPTRMVGSPHRPADASVAASFGEEQMLALRALAGEGDAPPVRVVEHHAVQRVETHAAQFHAVT